MLKIFVRSLSAISLALLFGMSGRQARAQISAPLVGLIVDDHGPRGVEVRPVLGIPGASSVRPSFQLAGVTRAYVAPGGGWALVRHHGPSLGLVTFNGSVPGEIRTLHGAIAQPDRVSFSPTGRSAALLSRSADTIQVLVGLDGSPRIAATIDSPQPPESLAVSDDGNSLVVLTRDGSLFFLSGSAPPQMIGVAGAGSGLAFLPNRSSAVLADRVAGTLWLLSAVQGVAGLRTVASGLDLLGAPVLIQASRDGASAFVVTQGGAIAYRIDLARGSIETAELPVPATRLDRLRDGETFVVSAEPGQTAWFLVGTDSGLGAVFSSTAREPEAAAAVQ